jgi:hypothetical protein
MTAKKTLPNRKTTGPLFLLVPSRAQFSGIQLLTVRDVAAHIESRGFKPLLDILRQLGGWPVLDGDAWDAAKFDWRQSVFNFRALGYSVDYFMDFSVSTDAKNSSYRSINVSYLWN